MSKAHLNKAETSSVHTMRKEGQLTTFGEVRSKLKHSFNPVNIGYLSTTHLLSALFFIPIIYAPEGLWSVMGVYFAVHMILALISTTAYAHRLISHSATRRVNFLVHLIFGYFGQTLAAQGSLASWAGKHRVHHAVDGNQHHDEDPYSAVWFTSSWRNFLWSHVLCYCFESPHEEDLFKKRTEGVLKQHSIMRLQHEHYLAFLIGVTKLMPFFIGYVAGGSLWAGLCLLWTSVFAIVCSQNITWSVNSVTHMWGVSAARSSAKNNYIWLLPLGEGNHHADHHDAPTDYRNGFGFTAWLLDPTRYFLLILRSLRLVGPLQRTPRLTEIKMIAERKLQSLSQKRDRAERSMIDRFNRSSKTLTAQLSPEVVTAARARLNEMWEGYDETFEHLKTNLYECAKRLDQLKRRQTQLISQRSQYTKEQLSQLTTELKEQLKEAKRELRREWRAFKGHLKIATAQLKLEGAVG